MEYGLHSGSLSTAGALQACSRFQIYNHQIFVALPQIHSFYVGKPELSFIIIDQS